MGGVENERRGAENEEKKKKKMTYRIYGVT